MSDIKRAIKSRFRSIAKTAILYIFKSLYFGRQIAVANATASPKRILVLNDGHVGDIVLSTSIIPILRSAYPFAKIGFVVGSWSMMVLKNHPDITYLHCVDHWLTNRNHQNIVSRMRQYWETRRTALKEIRGVGYDMALCIRPWYPDLLDLPWRAKIPARVGFRHSLLAPYATLLTDVSLNHFLHQSLRQAEILRPLGVDESHLKKRKAILPESPSEAIQEVSTLLQVSRIEDVKYRIIHMGSGELNRELPPEFWREVASTLSKTCIVLFTGRGTRETANIAHATAGLDNCVNACDKLSWEGFVAAVRHAELLYGVESMAGHVAAAVGTRCIVAYTGLAGVARWRPDTPLGTVFTNHLPCSPCYDIRGCKGMYCIRGVSPSDLIGRG